MAITAGLIAKVGIGLGVLGLGATAVYFGGNFVKNSFSKYDWALINFLYADEGNDLIFEVKNKNGEDLTDSNMTFGSSTSEDSISAKVRLNSGQSSTKKQNGQAATVGDKGMKHIKQLNKGND